MDKEFLFSDSMVCRIISVMMFGERVVEGTGSMTIGHALFYFLFISLEIEELFIWTVNT